jgi:hypothetical protein
MTVNIFDIVNAKKADPNRYASGADALHELAARLRVLEPRTIVECGSGWSTVVLAAYARANPGTTVVSLEDSGKWHVRTLGLLTRFGLSNHARVMLAPLESGWYQTDVLDQIGLIDFAFIDGPTQASGGRAQTFPHLVERLSPWAEVWLDDADRPDESSVLDRWCARYPKLSVDTFGRREQLARIVTPHPPTVQGGASDVHVTMLTGQRLPLFRKTLAMLNWRAPWVLDQSHGVTILCSGEEDASRYEQDIDGIDNCKFIHHPGALSIGEGMSSLAKIASGSGSRYWLHIEDDWTICTLDNRWLRRAKEILDLGIAKQVRLRHAGEPVLAKHLVTGTEIEWRGCDDYAVTSDAHMTFNPFLMKTETIGECGWTEGSLVGERHAQRQAHGRGVRSAAQLFPGVFRHSGEGRSRRLKVGVPA